MNLCTTSRRLQLRLFSLRHSKPAETQTTSASLPPIVRAATRPQSFLYTDQLVQYLTKNICAYEPGRFVVVPKPYGVSCVGHVQEDGGVFKNSIHDEEKTMKWSTKIKDQSNNDRDDVTIEECLRDLRRVLNEPKLRFCTGLKRYLSGAIVLPCNDKSFESIKKSIRSTSSNQESPYMYRALAITVDRPSPSDGELRGIATFRNVGKHKEYIFDEKRVTKRAKSGKFAVEGRMEYRVLGTRNGCSLVEFGVDKFARHMPRLMLSSLSSPILGDSIYWRRLADVDGRPTDVAPSTKGNKVWIPEKLENVLNMNRDAIVTSLPLYCHVYNTVFPDVGGPASQDCGLVAGSTPPPHFLAMLDVLGLRKYYKAFESEDLTEGEEDVTRMSR